VRVSAPHRASDDEVRSFVTSRIGWVRRKQQLFAAQEQEAPRRLVTGETHHGAGRPFVLEVVERQGTPSILLADDRILLTVRPRSDLAARGAVLDRWRRAVLGGEIARLIAQWEPVIGVRVARVTLRRMSSRWGTCNIGRRLLCFNTELAKKPPAYLEYVVVHEMVHLRRRSHDDRFYAFMDGFMPDWRLRRAALNHRATGTLAGPAGNEADISTAAERR
jgi:predicted metal-dependent hydrolase